MFEFIWNGTIFSVYLTSNLSCNSTSAQPYLQVHIHIKYKNDIFITFKRLQRDYSHRYPFLKVKNNIKVINTIIKLNSKVKKNKTVATYNGLMNKKPKTCCAYQWNWKWKTTFTLSVSTVFMHIDKYFTSKYKQQQLPKWLTKTISSQSSRPNDQSASCPIWLTKEQH